MISKAQQFIKGFIALSLFSGAAMAMSYGDIDIQSDTFSLNWQEGIAVHDGHVVVRQSENQINADTMTLTQGAVTPFESAQFTGSPVNVRLVNESGEPLVATAATVTYAPKDNQIWLSDGVKVTHLQHQMTADKVSINLATHQLHIPKGASPVHIQLKAILNDQSADSE